MATYNKFNDFVVQLNKAVHDLDGTHTLHIGLSNTAPVATNTIWGNITEIGTGNGYVAGGPAITTVTLTESPAGTAKVTCSDEVITASGGTIGPLRYVVIYNTTPTSPVDPLICWFDYGSSITLQDTETFTVDFNDSNGLFQLT